jgi:hypothetical protein
MNFHNLVICVYYDIEFPPIKKSLILPVATGLDARPLQGIVKESL